MPSVAITGSNRGLGLTWARQFAADGWRVFASCRHPADAGALQELAVERQNLTVHRLDVTSIEDIRGFHWELGDQPVDVLLNNAGIYLEKGTPDLGAIRYEDWLRTMEVNTLGAVRVTEALANNVAASDKRLVVVISSHMGSIADIDSPGSYYYRSSKAALNAACRGMAVALRPRGVGLLLLHPGGVKTRMGPSAGINAEDSVKGMRDLINRFEMAWSGRFFGHDGSELPW